MRIHLCEQPTLSIRWQVLIISHHKSSYVRGEAGQPPLASVQNIRAGFIQPYMIFHPRNCHFLMKKLFLIFPNSEAIGWRGRDGKWGKSSSYLRELLVPGVEKERCWWKDAWTEFRRHLWRWIREGSMGRERPEASFGWELYKDMEAENQVEFY